MHIPEGHLYVVRRPVFCECAFVMTYEVIEGGREYVLKENETGTLLRPGEFTLAESQFVKEDWSALVSRKLKITNQDGKAVVEALEENEYPRED